MIQITTTDFQESYARQLLDRAHRRAERSGLKCDLTPHDLMALWSRSGGCCEVSGRPFSADAYDDCLVHHPFAPSIDRVDWRDGYTMGNARLVCVAINFAMNQWGDQVYLELAKAAVEHDKLAALDRITNEWFGSRRSAICVAENRLRTLDGIERVQMQRHIAALKATLSKGPKGLAAAAKRAVATRNARRAEARIGN